MPSSKSLVFDPAKHLAQGKENEQLARALIALDSCYKDWVVTLAFYAALHYAYSRLPATNVPHTHQDAKPLILQHCGNTAFGLYSDLSDKSRNARYYPVLAKAYRDNPIVAEGSLKSLDFLKQELGIT